MGFLDGGRAYYSSAPYSGLPGNPVLNCVLFLPVTVTLSMSFKFSHPLKIGRWSEELETLGSLLLGGPLLLWGPQ